MKTIKNVLMVAFFMLGVTAFAQQNVGPNQNEPPLFGPKPNNGIVGRLNLSDDQQAKLKDIRKEYRQKDSISFAEFHNREEQKRIEELNEFKSILNKDQLDQLEKVQQIVEYRVVFGVQNGPNRMGRRNHRPMNQNRQNRMDMQSGDNLDQNGPGQDFARNERGPQIDRAKNLTPEEHAQKQTERLTKELNLSENQATEIKEINQKYAQEGSAKQGALKEKMIAKQNEIKSVLNKDQKEKYEALLEKAQNNKLKKLDNGLDQQVQPMR